RCPSAAVRIVGTCPHCELHFCSTHRLPEEHKCSHLQQCRDAAFEANRARLVSERTVARKVAQT
ncbi:hypothetical protein BDY24DRAFT_341309, partial [Mrakia frigida]|uniref:Tmc1p n=1 Tax=Mrakia frigida TaxID=29902 RepID=UPI003FCC0961